MTSSSLIYPGFLLQGRYQVIARIGGGGFGDIFEVDDGGITKVLKVLNLDNFNNPDIKQKATILFQREAEFLMSQRHPGIPRVETDGYFTWPEGSSKALPCLVMEKIPGQNLQEWMLARANQPITTETAIEWLAQLTKIINLLHEQQYFHRDIKPSNIMLKPDGELVLVDFGAVREVTETYLRQQKENYTGTAIISAGYTPSEQAEGHAVPQSDFFALGRTCVYLLTGKSPLELPKNSENGQLIWRDKATQVSPHLADLIDRMMAPFFGKRPQNCQEILQILARGESRSPLESLAQPVPEINYSIEPSKTHPLKDRLNFNWVSKLALASLFFLGGLWTLSPPIVFWLKKEGLDNHENKRLETAELYYKIALVFRPNDETVNYNLGVLYEDKNEYNKARAAYQLAVNAGFNKALNNLARLEILDRQYANALPLLEKALPLAKDDKIKYAVYKNLGWAQLELGRYEEANNNLKKAINISSDRSVAYCLEAVLLERQGNKHKSLSYWEKCYNNLQSESSEEQKWIRQEFSKNFQNLKL
ncbi:MULTISPECIES: protein kinase domain-containing protein [unclassified Microcoleus]|uniref:protein kinase domain-containing protein n=1 Tax=unclassified Microcoleus TaxID=2642155 RepID=UPI002FD4BE8C